MLRLPRFRMIEPTTWTAAAKLLREHGAAASDVAGGTPNVPMMLVAGGHDRREPLPRHALQLVRPVALLAHRRGLLHEDAPVGGVPRRAVERALSRGRER